MGDGLARVLSKQDYNPDACMQFCYPNIICIVNFAYSGTYKRWELVNV